MFQKIQNYFLLPPTVDFCEQPDGEIIARFGYFLSNFPYIGLGLYLFLKKGLARQFGIYSILIGLMSCLYDATYKLWAQHLDLLAMFVFISFLASLNIKILTGDLGYTKITQLGLPVVCLIIIILLGGSAGQILFIICTLLVLLSFFFFPKRDKIDFKYLNWAVLLLVVGFLAWIPDRFRLICLDFNLLNGRAVFHYLTTGTIYFVYRFYEKNKLAF